MKRNKIQRQDSFLNRPVSYTGAIVCWGVSLIIGLLLRYFLKGY